MSSWLKLFIARVHPVHLMNADWALDSRQTSDQADWLALWHTHTHPFNGPFSGTTQVSRYQWVAVASAGPYASLHLAPGRQSHQHPTTVFYRPDALPAAQPTASKHWRQKALKAKSTKGTDLRCESTKIGGYHPHHHCYLLLLLSPLADTRTQLLIFTSHRVNGWVDLGTAVKVCHPHRCYLDRQGVLEWQNGSNINQTICKQYAPRSRQLTMPTPHQSLFMGHVLNNVTALKALHGNYLVSWPRLHISVLAHRRCVDAPFFRVRTQTWET